MLHGSFRIGWEGGRASFQLLVGIEKTWESYLGRGHMLVLIFDSQSWLPVGIEF